VTRALITRTAPGTRQQRRGWDKADYSALAAAGH
jgi:hypothetical protein